jgi:hypothetical protein
VRKMCCSSHAAAPWTAGSIKGDNAVGVRRAASADAAGLIVDLRTIAVTTDVIKAVRLAPDRAVIVLKQARASSGFAENSLTVEARRELAIYGCPVATVAIGYSAALADALIDRRAVTEFDPTASPPRRSASCSR